MKSVIDRGTVTSLLITTLLTGTELPVGDSEAPEVTEDQPAKAGWSDQPGAEGSTFVPYTVLIPQTATTSSGPFDDPQDGWQLPYSLTTFGGSRAQCEALANRARKSLRGLTKQLVELDDGSYRIQQVWFAALGGIVRVDGTSPSTFGEVDTVTIWLSQ